MGHLNHIFLSIIKGGTNDDPKTLDRRTYSPGHGDADNRLRRSSITTPRAAGGLRMDHSRRSPKRRIKSNSVPQSALSSDSVKYQFHTEKRLSPPQVIRPIECLAPLIGHFDYRDLPLKADIVVAGARHALRHGVREPNPICGMGKLACRTGLASSCASNRLTSPHEH